MGWHVTVESEQIPLETLLTALPQLLTLPNTVYLDSNDSQSPHSVGSVVGLFPDFIMSCDTHPQIEGQCPFDVDLATSLGPLQLLDQVRVSKAQCPADYISGFMGYVAYEAAPLFDNFPGVSFRKTLLPRYWFGFYTTTIVWSSDDSFVHVFRTRFCRAAEDRVTVKNVQDLWQTIMSRCSSVVPDAMRPGSSNGQFQSNWNKSEYIQTVNRTKDHIYEGDIYQANITQRFAGTVGLSGPQIYANLRQASPAPYSAYIGTPDFTVLSASPELFFSVTGRDIVTRPIKGTIKRGESPDQDAQLCEALWHSEKDQAELAMIVDLERNDLGRICDYGSVQVACLSQLESYAQVHHLASTIRGRLRSGIGITDIFGAMFPGGSITGAPKLRSMQLISELETVPREVYTGAIGVVSVTGDATFNIAIRTLYMAGQAGYYHSGGGIVADSDPDAEWMECLAKVSGIRQCLWYS